MKLVTLNSLENGGLGSAVSLYRTFLCRAGEADMLDSVSAKFLASIDQLPEGPLPEDTTITVELADEEAALLVRVIDVMTHRDEYMESVREQLGGGETTLDENGDEETGEINLFDLLGAIDDDDEGDLTEVTLTVDESNLLSTSNYAYVSTYADLDDVMLLYEFGARSNAIIRGLPDGAEEVTLLYTEEEGLLIQRSLLQMDLEGRGVFATVMDEEGAARLNATLDSVMEKFSVEKESHDVPTPGPDEGGCAVDGDGLSSSGELAVSDSVSISES